MIKKYLVLVAVLLFYVQAAQSQVLISLIFGDKLNSDKIKFGLEGGVNFADVTNLENSSRATNFNLGFYFDFKMKNSEHWFLHTGVLVKSTMGAKLEPYSLESYSEDYEYLDPLLEDADVQRKLQYFNVPFLAKYKFNSNVFVEAGPMFGLLYKGNDIFTKETDGDELTYKNNIRKDHSRFDIGLEGGIGYQTDDFMNGMYFGARYYQGILNSSTTANADQFNTSYYVFVGIPIGAGDKAKAKKKAIEELKAKQKAEAIANGEDEGKKSKKKSKKN